VLRIAISKHRAWFGVRVRVMLFLHMILTYAQERHRLCWDKDHYIRAERWRPNQDSIARLNRDEADNTRRSFCHFPLIECRLISSLRFSISSAARCCSCSVLALVRASSSSATTQTVMARESARMMTCYAGDGYTYSAYLTLNTPWVCQQSCQSLAASLACFPGTFSAVRGCNATSFAN